MTCVVKLSEAEKLTLEQIVFEYYSDSERFGPGKVDRPKSR
jgi:hypothetical protein